VRLEDLKPFYPVPVDAFLSQAWTVGELARQLYPGVIYDPALPQPWVDDMARRWGMEARGSFIWAYPEDLPRHGYRRPLTGLPVPLVRETWIRLLRTGEPVGPFIARYLMAARMDWRDQSR
jgi:hypothetical protein